MTKSTIPSQTTFAPNHMPCGLAKWEVSAIEKAALAIEGCWTATAFECACCGKTTALVAPTCEAVDGPTFEFARNGRKILLTTTWLNGEDYYSEHWSVPAALSAMRAAISTATKATVKTNA